MKKAVLVYQATTVLGGNVMTGGGIFGMYRENKFVKKVNSHLKELDSDWIEFR
ncbi:hypothetical protein [Bacillus sp. 1P06AnD]|uniref:hypothetical protein n=1 Tax=Bacillus sp. 1P06AnD TaxID=3132208 RepID=UPI0039A3151E